MREFKDYTFHKSERKDKCSFCKKEFPRSHLCYIGVTTSCKPVLICPKCSKKNKEGKC